MLFLFFRFLIIIISERLLSLVGSFILQGKNIYGEVGAIKMAKTTKSRYTDVPVKKIANSMIEIDGKMKVSGVKIMPRNIFILDPSTQAAIISNLRTVYNVIDYEFWIIAADRPVDINVYLSELQVLYNSSISPVQRKLISEDMEKGTMFVRNSVVDTEYFLLFKHKDTEVIQKRIRNLINNFAAAGLTATQTSNDDLRMILDNFLNGGQTTDFGTVFA